MRKLSLLMATAAIVTVGAANASDVLPLKRQLDTIADNVDGETVFVPSVGEDRLAFDVVGIFWDERCSNVEYTFNTNQGANVGTAIEISPADLAAEVQTGLDRWNDIPTSFIEMNITRMEDLGDRPRIAGDFINEVTFITPAGFGALASSPSSSLDADTTFVVGDDLDLDGDSDVFDPEVEERNTCFDADGDGDIEFPAGFYERGTILDNDVQFGEGVVWELTPTDTTMADVDAVSTHEFGHSHGISHSFIDQFDEDDGTSATMFPFIDTGDAASETAQAILSTDDIAASSFIYPEGSGDSGPSALQSGDIAFEDAFDIITGDVFQSDVGLPSLSGNVAAIDRRTGRAVSNTHSGVTLIYGDGAGGLLVDTDVSYVNGKFQLPVPANGFYQLRLEALDGRPAGGGNISTTNFIGDLLGTNIFPEEFYNSRTESDIELDPLEASSFFSNFSSAQDISLITNTELPLGGSVADGGLASTAFTGGASEVVYAQQYDGGFVSFILDLGFELIGGSFETFQFDASLVPEYASVQLVLGEVQEDGTVELGRVLNRQRNFVGQSFDRIPYVVPNPTGIKRRIQTALARDPDLDVFLVVESTDDFGTDVGASGLASQNVLLDTAVASTPGNTGYLSIDGGPLAPLPIVYTFRLNFVPTP